jgi:hypothetical protein
VLPRSCRHDGCPTRVVLARYARTGNWGPFDATPTPVESLAVANAYAIVDGRAWWPAALALHFHTVREVDTETAWQMVRDYPHHLPHHHMEDPL